MKIATEGCTTGSTYFCTLLGDSGAVRLSRGGQVVNVVFILSHQQAAVDECHFDSDNILFSN